MLEESPLLQVGRKIDELRYEIAKLRDSLTTRVKPLLTVTEVAELTGRAPYTVRNWIKDGLIKAERVQGTGPRGRLLVPREQVEKIVHLGRGPSVTAIPV